MLNLEQRLARAEENIRRLKAENEDLREETGDLRRQSRTCMAQMVMQTAYVELTRQQLHGKEAANKEKAVGNGRLTTTHASLLTNNEWIQAAQSQSAKRTEEEAEREQKQTQMKVYQDAIAVWKDADRKRIEANQRKRGATKIAVGKWEKGGRVGKKPTAANITKAQPKPVNPYPRKRKQVAVEVDLQDNNEDEEDRMTIESEDEESSEDGDE
jgi:hypothetical protein